MLKKQILKNLALVFLLVLTLNLSSVYAGSPTPSTGSSGAGSSASQPAKLATSPAECETFYNQATKVYSEPRNCLFLEEPIGGRPGYDLYIIECVKDRKPPCLTGLWSGGSIPNSSEKTTYRGPLQAVLTEEPGKEYQGPFGLLYGYLALVYNYASGIIIGVAVLFIVIGGVQMITAGGQDAGITAGKDRIKKALVGLVLWFLASLILYTINPTFFTF